MTGYVYFIQVGSDGPIKIGFSKADPARRMKHLQAGCPWELRLVGAVSGSKFNERCLHEKLSHLKIRQEWFRPGFDIEEMLSPSFIWSVPESPVDRAILLAGSISDLALAIGSHQPTISAARSSGKVPEKVRQYLQSAESAA